MNFIDKLATAAGFIAGLAIMALAVICAGFAAKGVATLFCIGYGC